MQSHYGQPGSMRSLERGSSRRGLLRLLSDRAGFQAEFVLWGEPATGTKPEDLLVDRLVEATHLTASTGTLLHHDSSSLLVMAGPRAHQRGIAGVRSQTSLPVPRCLSRARAGRAGHALQLHQDDSYARGFVESHDTLVTKFCFSRVLSDREASPAASAEIPRDGCPTIPRQRLSGSLRQGLALGPSTAAGDDQSTPSQARSTSLTALTPARQRFHPLHFETFAARNSSLPFLSASA
jgi:hypothetical protein